VDREGRTHKPSDIPGTIAAACKDVAAGVRREHSNLRYDKIQAARTRIANGYYSTAHIARVVASRLLEEGALG
jgi:hypothetical protein